MILNFPQAQMIKMNAQMKYKADLKLLTTIINDWKDVLWFSKIWLRVDFG